MDTFDVATDRAYDRSLKHFEAFLIEQYQQNKVPTLFVDEAQNMTRDILKLIHYLLNFETSEVKLLQIVLTGQEELAEKVKRYHELRSRMIPIAINSMSRLTCKPCYAFAGALPRPTPRRRHSPTRPIRKSSLTLRGCRGMRSNWRMRFFAICISTNCIQRQQNT